MAGETTLTLVGNLTAYPELRTTQQGGTLCSFTIASTPRVYNRQSGQYEDGATLFTRCVAWRDLAQHCASSLAKGTRVIATGILRPNNYTDQQGVKHYGTQLTIDEIGPSLRYATAQVQRAQQGQNGQQPTADSYQQPAQQPADPWGNDI